MSFFLEVSCCACACGCGCIWFTFGVSRACIQTVYIHGGFVVVVVAVAAVENL